MKNTKILNQLMTQHGIKVTGNLHLVKEFYSYESITSKYN